MIAGTARSMPEADVESMCVWIYTLNKRPIPNSTVSNAVPP